MDTAEFVVKSYRICSKCGQQKLERDFYRTVKMCKTCFWADSKKSQQAKISMLTKEEAQVEIEWLSDDWVYRNLERFGNCLVSKRRYRKLNKARIGDHYTTFLKKEFKTENDCVIIWRR